MKDSEVREKFFMFGMAGGDGGDEKFPVAVPFKGEDPTEDDIENAIWYESGQEFLDWWEIYRDKADIILSGGCDFIHDFLDSANAELNEEKRGAEDKDKIVKALKEAVGSIEDGNFDPEKISIQNGGMIMMSGGKEGASEKEMIMGQAQALSHFIEQSLKDEQLKAAQHEAETLLECINKLIKIRDEVENEEKD